MGVSDTITIIYLMIPVISFLYGLMESAEKQKRYGKSSEENNRISKTVGILMMPAVLIQFPIVLLSYVFQSYVWKFIVSLIAICSLIYIVPRSFKTGFNAYRERIPDSTKEYAVTCINVFFILLAIYFVFDLVVKKWFELL